jgi:hypothetical protein
LAALCLSTLLLSCVAAECKRIRGPAEIKGKKFFDSTSGNYIAIKGICYYPRPNAGELSLSNSVDFFNDEYRSLWEADVANFQALGVNVVRLYGVSPAANHDAFMCALQNAGIYAIIGLLADCENCGIGPQGPPDCYPTPLKTRGQYVIQTFSRYDNVLAFDAGNEVALYAANRTMELNAPCQKQFLRDMRAYVQSCTDSNTMRKVPVGVVTADFDRQLNAIYYNCRSDPSDLLENAEWYGINAYLHCDGNAVSIEELDGFIELRQNFLDYNLTIPVVVAEFGCRDRSFPTIDGFEAQRTWLQIDALFSESYADVFAGAVAFEYSAEKLIVDESSQNKPWPYYEFMKVQYGVGYYSPVDCNHVDIPCVYNRYPEFELMADKFAGVTASFVPSLNDYDPPEVPIPDCPAEILPLNNFSWPTANEPSWWCPPEDFVFKCPATSACEDPTAAPTAKPVTTPAPFASTIMPTVGEMNSPTKKPAQALTESPSASPVTVLTETPAGPDNDNSSTGQVGLSSIVSLLLCVLIAQQIVW